jgi:predicted acylesterase/phospholipase RssA
MFRNMDGSYDQDSATDESIHPDIYHLSRWLAGTSVGLVLGRDGAKGAAHIGMLMAIEVLGSNKISCIQ